MAPKMKPEGTQPLRRVYKKLKATGKALFRLIRHMEDGIGPKELEMTTAKALAGVSSLRAWVDRMKNKHDVAREKVLDRMSEAEKKAAAKAAKGQAKTKK